MIKFGIEHEFVFKNNSNEYVDFQNSDYSIFRDTVDDLPYYKNDKKYFLKELQEI